MRRGTYLQADETLYEPDSSRRPKQPRGVLALQIVDDQPLSQIPQQQPNPYPRAPVNLEASDS